MELWENAEENLPLIGCLIISLTHYFLIEIRVGLIIQEAKYKLVYLTRLFIASLTLRPGAKLKGGYGGVTHPPPQLPISQGTEEVCRAKMWFRFRLQTVRCSMWMKMSISVENFLGFITCGCKGCPFFFNGRAVYPFTPPPQPKGASFAPDYAYTLQNNAFKSTIQITR